MKNYVNLIKNKEDNIISVCLYVQEDKLFAIGEKMNEINEEAYMNGYNWEAFFNFYLNKYYPEIIKGMESNPEAGAYFAEFEYSPENELKASKFIEIIEELIEDENNLYKIPRMKGMKLNGINLIKMKDINYIIHTKMDKDEIIDKIKNAKHYSKALMSSRMFTRITENKEGDFYLKPDLGVVNLMLVIWSYTISFKDLNKGFLRIRVKRKINYFAIGFFSFMYIVVFTVISIFLKDKNIGSMKNIIFIMFSTFIILSFALNYFSVQFSLKKIINLLTVLVKGEIEYVK